jgi:xylulokinase
MGETALLGSAVIAGCGVGLLSDYKKPIERVMRKGAEFRMDQQAYEQYAPCADKYLKAMDILTEYYKD